MPSGIGAARVEIVEAGLSKGSPAKPDRVRINGTDVGLIGRGGVEILLPETSDDVVRVRLTLQPGEIIIGADPIVSATPVKPVESEPTFIPNSDREPVVGDVVRFRTSYYNVDRQFNHRVGILTAKGGRGLLAKVHVGEREIIVHPESLYRVAVGPEKY